MQVFRYKDKPVMKKKLMEGEIEPKNSWECSSRNVKFNVISTLKKSFATFFTENPLQMKFDIFSKKVPFIKSLNINLYSFFRYVSKKNLKTRK